MSVGRLTPLSIWHVAATPLIVLNLKNPCGQQGVDTSSAENGLCWLPSRLSFIAPHSYSPLRLLIRRRHNLFHAGIYCDMQAESNQENKSGHTWESKPPQEWGKPLSRWAIIASGSVSFYRPSAWVVSRARSRCLCFLSALINEWIAPNRTKMAAPRNQMARPEGNVTSIR